MIDPIDGTPQAGVEGRLGIDHGGESGPQQAVVDAAEQQRGLETRAGDVIATGAWGSLDQAVEAQPPEIVAHASLGELAGREAQQGGELIA